MSTATTTLSGAISRDSLSITVASATGALVKNTIRIDDEWFTQTGDAVGTTIPVRGGEQGSARRPHVAGAVVQMGLPSDFAAAPAGAVIPVPYSPVVKHQSFVTVTGGSIPLPISGEYVFLTLLAAVTTAQTLADPLPAQEGQEVTIQAGAAHAYVVQAVDSAGVASDISFSGDQDIATFGGAIGDSFRFKAVSGAWQILNLHNVSLSDT